MSLVGISSAFIHILKANKHTQLIILGEAGVKGELLHYKTGQQDLLGP